ncbi:MAG: amidase [Chitinophagales bacterium]
MVKRLGLHKISIFGFIELKTMKFEEYRKYDATALAEMVRKKEIQPAELLQTAIERAEAVNPKVNAIVTKLYDEGKVCISKLRGTEPFSGVPFLMKDLGPQWKGTRYTCGSRLLKDYISEETSYATNKILSAGLLIFGKTNCPEFGLNPFTEPQLFGPSKNPWNTEYTTGGSSGGSAAAVASGIVPMASANDGGGSTRIPASCNGLFGMKTSRGRISLGPQFGQAWSGAVSEGVITRSVRDSAGYYDQVMGNSIGDPYIVQKPERLFTEEIKRIPQKLKIGYSLDFPDGFDFKRDEENVKAMNNTLKLLQHLGHEAEPVKLPYNKKLLTEMLFMMALSELSATVRSIGELRGKKAAVSELEPNTWLMYQLGMAFSAQDNSYAAMGWNLVARDMEKFYEKFDLLLTPTLGTHPFKLGGLDANIAEDMALRVMNRLGISTLLRHTGMIEKISHKIFNWIPYPPLANITGQPAMTVPLHWSEKGLPMGTMFTAPMNQEATLFQLAAQLEAAQPWFEKVPKI